MVYGLHNSKNMLKCPGSFPTLLAVCSSVALAYSHAAMYICACTIIKCSYYYIGSNMYRNLITSCSVINMVGILCKYVYIQYNILTASECPTLQHLDAFVRPLIAEKWYNLGLQLLAAEDVEMIKANHPIDASKACTAMFSLWLQKYPTSSWNSLISAIKGPGIEKHDVATKIELMLQPGNTNCHVCIVMYI